MKKILIIGGAGYIGSHMVDMLVKNQEYTPIVFDDLSSGFADAVLDATLIRGDLSDSKLLHDLFSEHHFAAVMHFASFIQVGESVLYPDKYYQNNFVNTVNLLNIMRQHNVNNFVFSSTAAVYGDPQFVPITEDHPKNPINPYGRSKWMVEQVLEDYEKAYGLHSVSLRYFNAAGADPDARLGERHDPETHLIPLVLQVASKRRSKLQLYGTDYITKDGSCMRDYVHVVDLCEAHLLALSKLLQDGVTTAYNLGNGNGFSNIEVIETAAEVTNQRIDVDYAPRRPGDSPSLIADANKARRELNWQPKFADLKTIIKHAWQWEQKVVGKKFY
jgi:UDP-glucose 4-epimerase